MKTITKTFSTAKEAANVNHKPNEGRLDFPIGSGSKRAQRAGHAGRDPRGRILLVRQQMRASNPKPLETIMTINHTIQDLVIDLEDAGILNLDKFASKAERTRRLLKKPEWETLETLGTVTWPADGEIPASTATVVLEYTEWHGVFIFRAEYDGGGACTGDRLSEAEARKDAASILASGVSVPATPLEPRS